MLNALKNTAVIDYGLYNIRQNPHWFQKSKSICQILFFFKEVKLKDMNHGSVLSQLHHHLIIHNFPEIVLGGLSESQENFEDYSVISRWLPTSMTLLWILNKLQYCWEPINPILFLGPQQAFHLVVLSVCGSSPIFTNVKENFSYAKSGVDFAFLSEKANSHIRNLPPKINLYKPIFKDSRDSSSCNFTKKYLFELFIYTLQVVCLACHLSLEHISVSNIARSWTLDHLLMVL